MRQHVTVVPADNIIIVDGEALRFAFAAPANVHAIQWHAGKGHMEFTDDYNHVLLGEELYAEDVAPFVALWEAEKMRLEEGEAAAEAARMAEYNSPEARAQRVRDERDRRIAATDYIMAVDYPLRDEQRTAWTAYRQALRDMPGMAGFPWDGGGDNTPWPIRPA